MKLPLPEDAGSNPLSVPILRILRGAPGPVSEHALMSALKASGDLAPFESADSLALFRVHFLVMNALYQLQQALLEDGFHLLVTPLRIQLEASYPQADQAMAPAQSDGALRDFYLDWRNLHETGAHDVRQWLNDFWQHYVADGSQLQAYQVLGLEPDADWPAIQITYRRLAAEQHPDRGGDAQGFIAIREAYETLRKVKG